MVNSRQKGARGEREIASILKARGYDAHRGQQYSGANGDADVEGVPGFHIEVKRTENFRLWAALDQSRRDAREQERPVVIHSKNGTGWVVVQPLDDWLDLVEEARHERVVSGDTSDGYHTFDELYYHRTALFACLVSMQPRQMAFKSWKHSDGTMYEGMFIAGIYTSRGWCTYHCDAKWWPLFDCSEREFAPEWDGHTPSDTIHRLMGDFLPKQEVCGEVDA